MPGKILHRSIGQGGVVRLTVIEERFEGDVRRAYSLPAEAYERLGAPAAGDYVDDEMLTAMAEAEGQMQATEKAVSLLSYGDNSCRGLYRKLRRRGYDSAAAEAAVGRMLQKGYIREEEQARRLAIACATRKLWGRRRIVAYLGEKGYDTALARRVIREAEAEGEIDFTETAKELIDKKLSEDAPAEERRKLLYRYGY